MPGPKKQFKCKVDLRIGEDLLAKLDQAWAPGGWVVRKNAKGKFVVEPTPKSRGEAIRLAIKRLVDEV